MPVVDPVSQTQNVFIKVRSSSVIPENLIAKVKLVKKVSSSATTLPKEAVLTDETQSSFWIMKMINDSTAIKVQIEKGIKKMIKVWKYYHPSFLILTGYCLPEILDSLILQRSL